MTPAGETREAIDAIVSALAKTCTSRHSISAALCMAAVINCIRNGWTEEDFIDFMRKTWRTVAATGAVK